ncbi:MAG: Peptidase family protein [Candidatus Kaiserbacteria bacterium]|nr:Peptidase family protein [Candidatus Kaiserbacteria bacterium]
MLILGTFVPAVARASVLSVILASIKSNTASADTIPATTSGNVQTMDLLKPATNIDPSPTRGSAAIAIVDDSALLPQEGPSGTIADIEKPKNGTISTYAVQAGDTIASVADHFNVSPNTIIWANDLTKSSKLKTGQILTILPITSVKYTVKKGDTIAAIAKRYSADAADIANYNGIDETTLAVGANILIPDGEVPASAAVKTSTTRVLKGTTASGRIVADANNPAEPSHNVGPVGTAAEVSYYISPLQAGTYVQTQGIHGYNAVDLAPYGGRALPVMASADGSVVVAKSGGYNGGYGSYVVISHSNGSQTLYSHLSKVTVSVGQRVVQGQVVGNVGETGEATGPHVHFEIRNGIRNPF